MGMIGSMVGGWRWWIGRWVSVSRETWMREKEVGREGKGLGLCGVCW